MTVEMRMPAQASVDGLHQPATLHAQVYDQLLQFFPFLEDRIRHIDSAHDDPGLHSSAKTAQPFPVSDPWTRGSATMRATFHMPQISNQQAALGPKTPLRGLWLCGAQVMPSLADEGQLLAAWSAAESVSQYDKKKLRMQRSQWKGASR